MQRFTVEERTKPRLDAAILKQFPQLTPGKLHKYLRENKIKVNGKKEPLSTRLEPGCEVCIYLPDSVLEVPAGPIFLRAGKGLNVVYEDDEVLCVDKPAGLAVMDEQGKTADTLINRALAYLYQKGEYMPQRDFEPKLCHRLDTGTSGAVLIAKTCRAQEFLLKLVKDRRIEKRYLCVTFGHPQPKQAVLEDYLIKDAKAGRVRVLHAAAPAAKKIITKYKTIAVSGKLALLDVELVTGRTHQIRAHMASIGCPILGDSKYGNNAANRERKLKYQALCAYSLRFPKIEENEPCAKLSGKTIHTGRPWYYMQILDGTLQ